ncbi:MAG: sialidase [Roseateles depolymerans]|uniref:Sialidase n=1 Tax=Roseateles depolymerans TaxID=76731 RepID=A0A2W5FVR3_9BURK|nr:MAG: sialidase [Roseateles depolymerans]
MRTDRAWAATRKGLFELRRGPSGWGIARVSFLGDPVTMLLPPDEDGFMLAALNLGHFGAKLHASDDAGASWRELPAPTFPPQPEGAEGPPWALMQVWSLERSPAGRLWAGTNPGGLFESQDRGESWQLNLALWNDPRRLGWFGGGNDAPALHSICPHPAQIDELLLGISCGGAWRTTDGGRHWALRASGMRAAYMPPEQADEQNVQDPHLIARCLAQPEVLWCQHHNGIFRSADNGASWVELTAAPSSFGFAVAAHPRDADTAWFVPAVKDERRIPVDGALCVTRTRDGGQTFEALRTGLPQQHCYDLVFRHGLAVDARGEQLLMGSTTGSLWASDDGGERWQGISSHLPPIYAVKFG